MHRGTLTRRDAQPAHAAAAARARQLHDGTQVQASPVAALYALAAHRRPHHAGGAGGHRQGADAAGALREAAAALWKDDAQRGGGGGAGPLAGRGGDRGDGRPALQQLQRHRGPVGDHDVRLQSQHLQGREHTTNRG